jgi:hypothetical protein
MSFLRNLTKFYADKSALALRIIDKHKGESLKAKILINYFSKKYLPSTENLQQNKIAAEIPETIWQFWDNPKEKETPEIVESCIKNADKFKGNFEHKVLNNYTIENYSDLPDYIMDKFKKGHIGYAHFSDLLRLNLLKNHGGIWLDATGYMTNFVPKNIIDEDFFVFLVGDLTYLPYSFMQNCFIRAKKGSYLCKAWYNMCVEYWKNENKAIDYFQHQLMFKTLIANNPTAKNLFNKMPHISEDETHQLVGDNLFKRFDDNEWERIKTMSFFQKVTYKVRDKTDCSGTYYSTLSKGEI